MPARRRRPPPFPTPETDTDDPARTEEEADVTDAHLGDVPFPTPSRHPEVGNPAGADRTLPSTDALLPLLPALLHSVVVVTMEGLRLLLPLGSNAVVVIAVEKSSESSPPHDDEEEAEEEERVVECRKLLSTAS